MRATMLIVLAGAAAAQTTERTWLYEDVTGRGDYRCTKVYDVPSAAALAAYRAIVGEEGRGWLYDQTGAAPRRIGLAAGWIPFLDANYSWSRPEPPTAAATCVPTGGGQVFYQCCCNYCDTNCRPGFTYIPDCINQGCSFGCYPGVALVTSVTYSGQPCCNTFPAPAPGTQCATQGAFILSFTLASLPFCHCDSGPPPNSPTLGPGHVGEPSLRWYCSNPSIGNDFWIVFMEVPSGTPTSHYLAVGPQHQGGPLTIQPPAACTAAYLYPHPSVILTYPGLFAAFRVPLPRNPALVGQQFRVQGASSSFPTGCLKFTDGILVTIRP